MLNSLKITCSSATSAARAALMTCGAALALGTLTAAPAFAIGSDSDGWITPTPGHPLGIFYQLRNSVSKVYSNGEVALNNAQFTGNVSLFRYLYPVQLPGDVVWTPNVIVPYANLRSGGDIAGLGSNSGVGDIILVSGFWPIHKDRTHLAIVPFLYLPTGKYNKNDALNPGENRYKAALQIGTQFPLGDSAFDFSGSIDTTVFGRNKDIDMKQAPLTEVSGWIKYNLRSAMYSHVAIGLGHVTGGETKLSGVKQADESRTTTARIQFGTLVDDSKTNHILFTVGRDLKVENGFKVQNHIQARFTHVF